MEKVTLILETKFFIECPFCGKGKSRIDHLFTENKEMSFGPWYCDECGGSYKGTVKGKDVFIEKLDGRKDKSIVFLKRGNILLCVEGMFFDGKHDVDADRYFYEEHTCPTNYFHDVEMVVDLESNDSDPHGIFDFITSIPYVDLEEVEDIKMLLPPMEP